MKQYVITSFYKFVNLIDFAALKAPMIKAMADNQILGTIILANEGINGGLAGTRKNMDAFYTYLRQDRRFADLWFKETYDDFIPFAKIKVKLRKEIVTMGVNQIDPLENSGTYVAPEEWNQLIADPEVLLIDTRNDYEVNLGTFKNAINPKTEHFRDFPDYVDQHLLDKKDKKIAMCCTGGIRCEKSTAYLKKLGFKEVYHLQGGILNYLDNVAEENSLWEGTCFVFDDRIAVE